MNTNTHITSNHEEREPEAPKRDRFRQYVLVGWEIMKIIILAAVIVIPIRYFVFQPFIVKGESMSPNFESRDYLIIDEISYRLRDPQRGDVVVFKYPLDPRQHFIKRIIGLPKETVVLQKGAIEIIRDGESITLNEASYLPPFSTTEGNITVTLEEDEYFVMGDNRQFSYDSRRWGVLPKKDIVGRAWVRLFPITNMSFIQGPQYGE